MRKLAAALCALLLLPSCGFIASDTESLLHPPALTRQQAAINTALADAFSGLGEVVYKYPQRGEFRTPFVFYDMDGDGREEAIVFYSYQNDLSNTRTMILHEASDGTWVRSHDISTGSDQVNFVQFSGLISQDSSCMIVGWQNTAGQSGRSQDSTLSVYSLAEGAFTIEISAQHYREYLVRDFDGDGLEEIVTLELDDSLIFRLSLLRKVGRHIAVSSSLPLCPEADTFLQMLPGKLWDGGGAIYIDEIRNDTSVATEVVRVRGDGMTILVGGERPETPEQELLRWDSYTDTWRDEPVLSMDIRGDGNVEVPYPVSLPGNLYEGQDNPLKLTGMLQLTAMGFVNRSSAIINLQEGYLVRYPDKWQGRVSVVLDDDSLEWRFYDIDPVTEEPVTELLRIRSDSSAERPGSYIELGERAQRYFSGYIPLTAEEVPGITESELRTMFQVLP